jgi:hypothetical protein
MEAEAPLSPKADASASGLDTSLLGFVTAFFTYTGVALVVAMNHLVEDIDWFSLLFILAALFVVAGLVLRIARRNFGRGWVWGTVCATTLLTVGLFWLAVTVGS